MDYLDPKKKQAHKIRIMIGYGLFAVLIAILTVLLVYVSEGYFIDRDTGEVVQNGLVYVDTKPGGAQVSVNGELQRGLTDVRLVIPEGSYVIDVAKDGYRSWSRSLQLDGGSLRQLTYAKLIPKKLLPTTGVNLSSDSTDVSQSIDGRWLVVSHATNPLNFSLIDLSPNGMSSQDIQIPKNIVSDSVTGQMKVVEWAGDNRHFLAKYSIGDVVEYLLVDKDSPALSVNLSVAFGNKTLEIRLDDLNNNKFFVYNSSLKTIFKANLVDGVSKTPMLEKVTAYRIFSSDWILYITKGSKEGFVEARFKRGDKDILLKEIKQDTKYLLEIAKLGTAPVMAISSPIENRVIVYNDPQKYLDDNPSVNIPVATTVMKIPSIQDLSISSDSSVVMGYGLENFAAYEFNALRSYSFKTLAPLDLGQEVKWADGQHIVFSSGGIQQMIDFDGGNQYNLVGSVVASGSFYSKDLRTMYTFNTATSAGQSKTPESAKLMITSLLIPSDQ